MWLEDPTRAGESKGLEWFGPVERCAYVANGEWLLRHGGVHDGHVLSGVLGYHLKRAAWERLTVATAPGEPARSNHAAAFSEQSNSLIIHGGKDDRRAVTDTLLSFHLGYRKWEPLHRQMGGCEPPQMYGHSMSRIPMQPGTMDDERFLVLGLEKRKKRAKPGTDRGEVWSAFTVTLGVAREWSRLELLDDGQQPPPRRGAQLWCTDSQFAVMMGGRKYGAAVLDVWLLDLGAARWRPVVLFDCPTRSFVSMTASSDCGATPASTALLRRLCTSLWTAGFTPAAEAGVNTVPQQLNASATFSSVDRWVGPSPSAPISVMMGGNHRFSVSTGGGGCMWLLVGAYAASIVRLREGVADAAGGARVIDVLHSQPLREPHRGMMAALACTTVVPTSETPVGVLARVLRAAREEEEKLVASSQGSKTEMGSHTTTAASEWLQAAFSISVVSCQASGKVHRVSLPSLSCVKIDDAAESIPIAKRSLPPPSAAHGSNDSGRESPSAAMVSLADERATHVAVDRDDTDELLAGLFDDD